MAVLFRSVASGPLNFLDHRSRDTTLRHMRLTASRYVQWSPYQNHVSEGTEEVWCWSGIDSRSGQVGVKVWDAMSDHLRLACGITWSFLSKVTSASRLDVMKDRPIAWAKHQNDRNINNNNGWTIFFGFAFTNDWHKTNSTKDINLCMTPICGRR